MVTCSLAFWENELAENFPIGVVGNLALSILERKAAEGEKIEVELQLRAQNLTSTSDCATHA